MTLAVDTSISEVLANIRALAFDKCVGTINAVGNTLVCDVRQASNVAIHYKNIGTVPIAAGTFVIEGSLDSTDGTDGAWFTVNAVRSNASQVDTGPLTLAALAAATGNVYAHLANVASINWLRVRNTVNVTASASAQFTIQRTAYASEPVPASQVVGTQPVSGTVTASIQPATTGVQNYSAVTTASTNAANIKNTAGSLSALVLSNPTATPVFVKIYDKATAPTVGTDIPKMTVPVPASSCVALNFGTLGMRLTAGIGVGATAAAVATDTGVAVAGVQIHGTYL